MGRPSTRNAAIGVRSVTIATNRAGSGERAEVVRDAREADVSASLGDALGVRRAGDGLQQLEGEAMPLEDPQTGSSHYGRW